METRTGRDIEMLSGKVDCNRRGRYQQSNDCRNHPSSSGLDRYLQRSTLAGFRYLRQGFEAEADVTGGLKTLRRTLLEAMPDDALQRWRDVACGFREFCWLFF